MTTSEQNTNGNGCGDHKNVNINTTSTSMFNFLLGIILASFVAFGMTLYNGLKDDVRGYKEEVSGLRVELQETRAIVLEYIKKQ